MAFKPTPSQKEAIETRGSAVLVSAGAGSGKTRVLTERLMAYVSDEANPVDLDSFLIITFTRAAAYYVVRFSSCWGAPASLSLPC